MRYQNKIIPLNIKKVKSIYSVGDIHGDFLTFADDLVNSCKVKNCCVIVCGDIGLGFFSNERMAEFFEKMEQMFALKNIYVIFFRGNHDDPDWFIYKEDEFTNNYPHVIIAEDFTIVEHNNKVFPYKILLWGGAISIDRNYRYPGTTYWRNEEVVPLSPEFEEDKQINCVCSHSAPAFCLPINSSNLQNFFKIDSTLKEDLTKEREILENGAYMLKAANKSTLNLWLYGHYHDIYYNNPRMNDDLTYFEPVRFIGLDMLRYPISNSKCCSADNYNFYNRKHKNHIVEIIKF